MSYSRQVSEKAREELARRRKQAQQQRLENRERAFAVAPELAEIEKRIADIWLSAGRALGMKEGAREYIDSLSEKSLAEQREFRELLVKNGFPEDYLELHRVCDKCRDSGYVDGVRCECYSGLLRRYSHELFCEQLPAGEMSFERFSLDYYPSEPDPRTGISPRRRMGEILNFCRSYASDFDTDSPSLLMHGATGLGKTHLSVAIAAAATQRGFGVIYGSAQNLLFRLEKEHFSKNSDFDGAQEALLDCELLVIDDLGAEFSTAFTVSAVYNIINTRIMRSLPTIISTNLSMEELEGKYQQRITSRILGSCIALSFCGRDVRQLKQ